MASLSSSSQPPLTLYVLCGAQPPDVLCIHQVFDAVLITAHDGALQCRLGAARAQVDGRLSLHQSPHGLHVALWGEYVCMWKRLDIFNKAALNNETSTVGETAPHLTSHIHTWYAARCTAVKPSSLHWLLLLPLARKNFTSSVQPAAAACSIMVMPSSSLSSSRRCHI